VSNPVVLLKRYNSNVVSSPSRSPSAFLQGVEGYAPIFKIMNEVPRGVEGYVGIVTLTNEVRGSTDSGR
jgi:hypothetical protein